MREYGSNEVGRVSPEAAMEMPLKPDTHITIEQVPGGFILQEDWGSKRSVCANMRQLIAAIELKYSPEGSAK